MNNDKNLNSEQELFKLHNELYLLLDSLKSEIKDEEFDIIMIRALKSLGNLSRADRCFIWENYYLPGSKILCMKQIYEWVNEEYAFAVQDTDLVENIVYEPDLYELLSAGNTLNGIVKDFDDYNREVLSAQNIKSILCVPIHIENLFWGFIGFDNCQTEALWSPFEEKVLISVSLTIGKIIMAHRDNKL